MSQKSSKINESIISGALKFSISSWANLIIGPLAIVITTRLLSPDTYGIVNLFIAFADVLMYIIALGFDGALIRFYNEPPLHDTRNQLMYKCITISIAFGIVFGLLAVLLLGDLLSSTVFGFSSRVIIALVFIYALERLILRYLNISFRMAFNSLQFNIQNILNNCLMRLLVILGAFFLTDSLYIVATISIGYAFLVMTYLLIQKNQIMPYSDTGRLNFSLSLRGYGEYIKYAFFSAPTYIINYANTFLSLQIIRFFCGTYFVGIFSSASVFGSIVAALSGGFSTYWMAYVYKNYSRDQNRIKKMHSFVLLFAIVMASLFVVFRDVLFLFIGADYHESKSFYSLLLIAPLCNFIAVTTIVGIGISKKNHLQLITTILAIVLNLVLSFFLIQTAGVIGAAIANAVSSMVQFFLNSFFGQRYYSTIEKKTKSIVGIVLLIVILVLPALFSDMFVLLLAVLFVDFLAAGIFIHEIKRIGFLVCKKFKEMSAEL